MRYGVLVIAVQLFETLIYTSNQFRGERKWTTEGLVRRQHLCGSFKYEVVLLDTHNSLIAPYLSRRQNKEIHIER